MGTQLHHENENKQTGIQEAMLKPVIENIKTSD